MAKKAFSHYFPRSRVPCRLISRIFPQSPRQIPHTPARSHCLSNSARHSLFLCKSWQSILTRLTFLFSHVTGYQCDINLGNGCNMPQLTFLKPMMRSGKSCMALQAITMAPLSVAWRSETAKQHRHRHGLLNYLQQVEHRLLHYDRHCRLPVVLVLSPI